MAGNVASFWPVVLSSHLLQWVYRFILGAQVIRQGSEERSIASERGNLKIKSRSRYSLRGVHGHFCEAMVADPWTFLRANCFILWPLALHCRRRTPLKSPQGEN